ncbi:MAG: VIT1/CCC1 transporter family protein [Nitrososphaerales archaeon]
MNGFDGALAMLGIVIGSYIAGVNDARIILSTGFGASLAMGISGAWGAFMAEKAQRVRKIKELEQAMFTDLKNSIIDKASTVAVIWVALVDALSPIITALISLLPFFISLYGFLSLGNAIITSMILNIFTLFILGLFLGRISRSNMITQGTIMTLAGIVTLFLLFALKLAF